MVMYVQLGKHSSLMCPANWTPYVHLHKTAFCVRSIWHLMDGHSCRSIQYVCVHVWTHCTHRECSTSTQVEREQIAWLPCCYKFIWHNRSGNVQAHHECIRCWEHDQSLYKCIHVHITCNRSWMEITTFDYKVHVFLKQKESSCQFPRHADTHHHSALLRLTLFWHWLVYQGGPVVRAQTQVQHDKQETRKRLPQDCQIGRCENWLVFT